MPTVAFKGIEAVLVLVFGFSIFSWFLPGHSDDIKVDIKAFQSEVFYGFIEFGKEKSYLEIREVDGDGDVGAGTKGGKVKISFRRKGNDYNLIYERGQEATDTDKLVIEKILDEIDKMPPQKQGGVIQFQQRITDTLKSILNRPSKSKSKRGVVGKFLP